MTHRAHKIIEELTYFACDFFRKMGKNHGERYKASLFISKIIEIQDSTTHANRIIRSQCITKKLQMPHLHQGNGKSKVHEVLTDVWEYGT